ncbi:MAG: hypothetical protein ABIT69_08745 [Sphingomicrobium sp.]
MTTAKADQAIARADRVMRALDERDGPALAAARRERQRLNAGLGRTVKRVAVALGLIALATIVVGLNFPIGMFGFLAALLVAAGAAGVLMASGRRQIAAPDVPTDLPNGEMVQRFDSYIFRARRALPPPGQREVDQLSAALPPLRQVLERIDTMDPAAQDARRLMSVHLPGLIDRYLHVPAAYRRELDGEGKSADERLVEALAAGRDALADISARLARADLAAFETQGRFIQSRYKDETID